MALNTVLLTLAGISMAADLAVVAGPNLGNNIGVPNLGNALYMPMSQKDSKLSVQFQSAKVSEVLGWLKTNGFNFVVNDGDIVGGKTVTLNVTNQTIGSIADAVASALGGHWEQTNGIHVYKKGSSPMNWMKLPSESSSNWGDEFSSTAPNQSKDIEKLLGPDFQEKIQKQFGPDFQKKIQDQFGPDFQEKIQKQFGPDFQKKMQDQFGPDFQKKFQGQLDKDSQKKLEDQFGPKFQKRMEDQFGPKFQKRMEDLFGPKFQKQMEDQFGPKFQRQMEDQFGPKFQKQMEDQFGPKFQKQMEDMGAQIQKEVEKNKTLSQDWTKNPKNRTDLFMQTNPSKNKKSGFFDSSGLGRFDATRFLGSLTPSEKDQQKKQGYVWYNDLSRNQKRMFDQFEGKFDIDLKVNGEEIRVRRN